MKAPWDDELRYAFFAMNPAMDMKVQVTTQAHLLPNKLICF